MWRRAHWIIGAAFAAVVLLRFWAHSLISRDQAAPKAEALPFAVEYFQPGWKLQVARRLPEKVSAIATALDQDRYAEDVYVGTGPVGGIYRFHSSAPHEVLRTLALGLGDAVQFGSCNVSCLAVRDLDHDGTPELVAETSQILPLGQPRLYVWSLASYAILRGVARPDVSSSWSHGLGFTQTGNGDSERIVSTFCGHGEIVEYQLVQETLPSGFRSDGVAWRQLGQLPASGEGVQAVDVDNDGQPELCLATGYSEGKAAIHIYSLGAAGLAAHPEFVLDEGGRLSNVKFLVGDPCGDGSRDLVAWWCTDVNAGDCEIVRYRFDSSGLRQRIEIARGNARDLWPSDGQITLADLAHHHVTEFWFATVSGNVWRYDPSRSAPPTRVCSIDGEIGPIAGGSRLVSDQPSLYIGCGSFVLRLQRAPSEQ